MKFFISNNLGWWFMLNKTKDFCSSFWLSILSRMNILFSYFLLFVIVLYVYISTLTYPIIKVIKLMLLLLLLLFFRVNFKRKILNFTRKIQCVCRRLMFFFSFFLWRLFFISCLSLSRFSVHFFLSCVCVLVSFVIHELL
jgi:hypothetical protein